MLKSMVTSQNLATLQRWIAMADTGFAGDFLEVFTIDYAGHISGRVHLDLEGLRQTELGFALAFTETVRTVHELLAFEDRALMRITTAARHTGTFRGIAAMGRPICFTALVLYRFRDGRICESWTELDLAGLLAQLTVADDSKT
jgi:predicted ester cyclase